MPTLDDDGPHLGSAAAAAADPLDQLWHDRHRDPDGFARRVAELPDGPVTTVLRSRVAWVDGRWDDTLDLVTQACEHLGPHDLWRARALETAGITLIQLGLDADAQSFLAEAGRVYDVCADPVGRASAVQNTGAGAWNSLTTARAHYLEALALAEPVGDDALTGVIMLNLGDNAHERGEPLEVSTAWLRRGAALLERSWPDVYVKCQALLAGALMDEGAVEEARASLAAADRPGDVTALVTRVALCLAQARLDRMDGRPEQAAARLRECLAAGPNPPDELSLQEDLSRSLEEAGDCPGALAAARRAVAVARSMRESESSRRAMALETWHRTQQARRDREAAEERAATLEEALDELHAAHARIQELSSRDPLTGLHNRQHLMDQGTAHVAQARPGHPAQVALLDLDRFKAINDTYGHGTGDQVLRQVAALLRRALPGTDLVARYGGEEFVVVRPPAGGGAARSLANDLERVRRDVHESSGVLADGSPVPPTSLSIGVVRTEDPDLAQALHAADDRMYAAKRAGGDRVWTTPAPCLGLRSRTEPPGAEAPRGETGRG